ncbi:MAG: TIGR02281 family clan AA aspartic protease [Gammaproteobacteria bacterium]
MQTRTAGLLVLALITGWGLGWVSRDRWGPEPQIRMPSRVIPSAPWGVPLPASPVDVERPERSDAFRQLLESKAFERALEHYEALQAQADDATVQRARGQLLEHARQLIAQADYPSAIRLLQLFLLIDYRDVEASLLLANAWHGEGDLRAAIGQFYDAKGQAWRPETLEELTRSIRAVVAEAVDALKQRGDADGLLELYQDLTRLEPSYAPYFIGLATAQLALDDIEAARQSLLLVAQDPEVGARARELLERVRVAASEAQPPAISVAATEVAGIPLVRNGNHFLVDARLGLQQARLLIDTGASLTMLTPATLQRSGTGARATGRTGLFNTANGRVSAPIYRLDALSVGDWRVSDLDVGVLELGDPGVDGLLGMNFLRHFQFFIDQSEALLRLSIAADPKK